LPFGEMRVSFTMMMGEDESVVEDERKKERK
jgi:hypothetical protein